MGIVKHHCYYQLECDKKSITTRGLYRDINVTQLRILTKIRKP